MVTLNTLLSLEKINKEAVRKYFGVTEKTIARDILILKEWLKKQPHLPQNQDDLFLEIVLLKNKFRIEKVKVKLDAYYSAKHHFKEYFLNISVPEKPSNLIAQVITLPKLTPQNERITIFRMKNTDHIDFDVTKTMQMSLILADVRIRCDYVLGDVIIYDCKNVTFEHFKKVPLMAFRDLASIYQTAFSGKIIAIHAIHLPKFINIVMNLLKQVLSPKLYGKILLHDSVESLFEYIPKEYLPDMYNPNGEKIDDILENWDKYLKENRSTVEEKLNQVSDESLRIGKLPYGDLIELEGTFKKIDID